MSLSGTSGKESKTVTVIVPQALHLRSEKLMNEKGFESFSDYLVFLLRKSISEYEADQVTEQLKPDEIERIKQRLRSLGYL